MLKLPDLIALGPFLVSPGEFLKAPFRTRSLLSELQSISIPVMSLMIKLTGDKPQSMPVEQLFRLS